MRIDPDILYDWVPKFLRDGWQVVSIRVFCTRSAPLVKFRRTSMQ